MPLFSRNDQDEPSDSSNGRGSREHEDGGRESPPPDEHTRLLPNRVDSNRVRLTPDDPAVSPYNLWSVRILRYLTILFAAATFVWWVLLLVTPFATLPGFHVRGSGFFAFSYASLAFANTLFTLVFFGVPSKAVRILAVVMAVSIDCLVFTQVSPC